MVLQLLVHHKEIPRGVSLRVTCSSLGFPADKLDCRWVVAWIEHVRSSEPLRISNRRLNLLLECVFFCSQVPRE